MNYDPMTGKPLNKEHQQNTNAPASPSTPSTPSAPPFYQGAYSQTDAPQNPPYLQPTPVVKPNYRGIDALFAWLSIAVGFAFVRAMPLNRTTLGSVLFFLLLYAFGGIYLRTSGVRLTRSAYLLAVCAVILSVGMLTNGNATTRGFLSLFLVLAFPFWLYFASGLGGRDMLGNDLIPYALRAVFVVPLTSLEHIFPALFAFRKKNAGVSRIFRTVGWIALGLCVAVVPTVIVILLLSYDKGFMNLLDRIFSFSIDGVWEFIRDLVLGFFVAVLVFGILFGVKWRKDRSKDIPEAPVKVDLRVFPKALLCTAITPILVVYVIFFISQWDYYISAFTHVLPGDLTYAAYAREGFFQLCGVCALNAVLLILFRLLMRHGTKARDLVETLYSSVISIFTLILIATAMSKMFLYIDSYGLTHKRVYASWLMLVLAISFVLVQVSSVCKKLRLIPAIALTAVLCFGLIALPDVDGMIASYNVNAYLNGDLGEIDVESIAAYGASSVPALVELRDTLTARPATTETDAILTHTHSVLAMIECELSNAPNDFFYFNIPDARARAVLKD